MDISSNVASACCSLNERNRKRERKQEFYIKNYALNKTLRYKLDKMSERKGIENNVLRSNSIYGGFTQRSENTKWMNECAKQIKIEVVGACIICAKTDIRSTMHSCIYRCTKKAATESVMNYRQNEMTAIPTHILYLIDLIVHCLCLVSMALLHKSKRTRWRMNRKRIDRWKSVKEHSISMGNRWRKRNGRNNNSWKEKASHFYHFNSALCCSWLDHLSVDLVIYIQRTGLKFQNSIHC